MKKCYFTIVGGVCCIKTKLTLLTLGSRTTTRGGWEHMLVPSQAVIESLKNSRTLLWSQKSLWKMRNRTLNAEVIYPLEFMSFKFFYRLSRITPVDSTYTRSSRRKKNYSKYYGFISIHILPAHCLRLQSFSSLVAPRPVQSFPPCSGAGLVHVLVRVVVPLPQDFVQALHEDHWDKPPFTKRDKYDQCQYIWESEHYEIEINDRPHKNADCFRFCFT